jgi:hypothetical protein
MAITNGYGVEAASLITPSSIDLSKAGPIAATIFAATGPIGGTLASIAGIAQALGLNIQGPTKHLSFAQATNTIAVPAVNKLWPLFQSAYTYNELQVIALKVFPRFANAMTTYWGMGSTQNQAIFQNIESQQTINNALNNQLVMFFIWVGTNIDADRAQSELVSIVPTYWSAIFEGAISDAGLDPAKLIGSQKVITDITGPNPNAGTPVVVPPAKTAGVFGLDTSSLLFIGVIVGGLFLVSKKGK